MTSCVGLLSDVQTEQAAQVRLCSADGLRDAAAGVARVAKDVGAEFLVGSSREALVLAGAVSAVSGVPVVEAAACTQGPVILLETVLATGVGIARAVETLPNGVGPVLVVAVVGPSTVPVWLEAAVDKVVVLGRLAGG